MMNRMFIISACLVSVVCHAVAEPQQDPPPNIIFVLTDDQGYGDLESHGHPYLKTPNIDTLRNESVRFDNFYVSPSCSPTRAALLTGMHEFKSGVTHTIAPREHLNLSATTLASLLKSAGYSTAHFGKWHLGYGAHEGKRYEPEFRGFDLSVRIEPRGKMPELKEGISGPLAEPTNLLKSFFDSGILRNGQYETTQGFREDVLFDEAMQFIETNKEHPFFCYLATFSPHTPLGAPESFIEPYRAFVSEADATYLGMVANVDWNMGRLMAKLNALGLAENTIVVFMSDNGATWGTDMYNAGMRGCKCTAWQGGNRAISFWRWPTHWQPKDSESLTAHVDLLPTFCKLAGATVPAELNSKLDGNSLLPLLESKNESSWPKDRLVFQHVGRWPSGMAAAHKDAMGGVRQGDYLLVRMQPCADTNCTSEVRGDQCASLRAVMAGATSDVYTKENAGFHWGTTPGAGGWSLYDVRQDPACQMDLSAKFPERTDELKKSYYQWWDDLYPTMIQMGGDGPAK